MVLRNVLKTIKKRQKYYEKLSTFDTFGRGWTRRVDETTELALSMIRRETKSRERIDESGKRLYKRFILLEKAFRVAKTLVVLYNSENDKRRILWHLIL